VEVRNEQNQLTWEPSTPGDLYPYRTHLPAGIYTIKVTTIKPDDARFLSFRRVRQVLPPQWILKVKVAR
jgi:hypothetical protein